MNPSETYPLVSADLFSIVAKGEWVLQGDELRLTQQPELRTTSMAVATVFGKEHSKVLRAIRNMDCSQEFNAANFGFVTYIDDKGERRPIVEMTRKGFEFLVLGFTGRKAAQFREDYVERFHQMEAELVKKTNEIQNLSRRYEHLPFINGVNLTARTAKPYRIKNPDFIPIPGVSILQTARGEGDYAV